MSLRMTGLPRPTMTTLPVEARSVMTCARGVVVLLVFYLVAPGDRRLRKLLELFGQEGHGAWPEVRIAGGAADCRPFEDALEHPGEALAACGRALLPFMEGGDGGTGVTSGIGEDQPVDVIRAQAPRDARSESARTPAGESAEGHDRHKSPLETVEGSIADRRILPERQLSMRRNEFSPTHQAVRKATSKAGPVAHRHPEDSCEGPSR